MTIESAKEFLEKVKTDEEFADRIRKATSREKRREIARSEGFDFTPEEIKNATDELSEEDLDAVAGGKWACGSTHESEGGASSDAS